MGVALSCLALWVPAFWIIAGTLIVFQTGHSLSPVALAWSHQEFRCLMFRRPVKYIWIPFCLLTVATFAGYVIGQFWPAPKLNLFTLKMSVTSYWHPLFMMATVYGLWNIYHFGKQNFGVMSIYRRKAGGYNASQRHFDLVYCCLMAWATMGLPLVHFAANYFRVWFLGYYEVLSLYAVVAAIGVMVMLLREWRASRLSLPRISLILGNGIGMGAALWWPLGGIGIISLNHWLTAIGLAGHTYANHRGRQPYLFSLAITAIGLAMFCLLFVDMRHLTIPTEFAAAAVAFRLALGNVHFLYDRWVWKLSDPAVRETIGRDLLAA